MQMSCLQRSTVTPSQEAVASGVAHPVAQQLVSLLRPPQLVSRSSCPYAPDRTKRGGALDGLSVLLPADSSSLLLVSGAVACGRDTVTQVPATRWGEDAVAALAASHGAAKVLAGGQSLVPMLNFRLVDAPLFVDINGIDGLSGISETGDGGERVGERRLRGRLGVPPPREGGGGGGPGRRQGWRGGVARLGSGFQLAVVDLRRATKPAGAAAARRLFCRGRAARFARFRDARDGGWQNALVALARAAEP